MFNIRGVFRGGQSRVYLYNNPKGKGGNVRPDTVSAALCPSLLIKTFSQNVLVAAAGCRTKKIKKKKRNSIKKGEK